jgi:1-acyl-sn-glycerol-3-phosphate acyltransferase
MVDDAQTTEESLVEESFVHTEDAAGEEVPPIISSSTSGDIDGVELPDEQAREQLAVELDNLIDRIKQVSPEYSPPPFSPQGLINLISGYFRKISPQFTVSILEQLRAGVARDLFDLDTWRGIWYVVNYSIQSQKDLVVRRIAGEYETQEWGYDPEVVAAVLPFFQFLYKTYWRVEVSGIANIPEEGRAVLVSNHSGQLPFDCSMVGLAIQNEHPAQRTVRTLYSSWYSTLPVISSILVKTGQVLDTGENGIRLLEQDQLVAVYPEGDDGMGKLFKDRYRLARFRQGSFVAMAIKTGSPMIPVSVVGAEETYISLAYSQLLARLFGLPYFTISVTFPWLGLLGLVPLPTKWFIEFGEPIQTNVYAPQAAENLILVSQIADQMRNMIQNMIYTRLSERRSVLFG